jgi:molybdopterin converting factor small subunit
LASSQPQAASILQDKRVRACLGDLIVGDDHVVQESDVIELLAPVSGG